jgi:splicing factor U2AF subunit
MAALQQQQQLQRQLMLQQQLILQQQAMAAASNLSKQPGMQPGMLGMMAGMAGGASTASTADRKAREIYVGNLSIGHVTAEMLKELFNTVLANQVQDVASNPPVVEVKMDGSGKSQIIARVQLCHPHSVPFL